LEIRDNILTYRKAPTMRDIADRCGVSRATVSRALSNNTEQQSEETIARIRAVAQEMGYDPVRGLGATRLAFRQYGVPVLNYAMGMFFSHGTFISSNYFIKMQRGILDAIHNTDFEIYTSDWYTVETSGVLPMAYRKGDIDGIVTMAQQSHWSDTLQILRSDPSFATRPIVGLVEHLDGCSGVYPEHFSGAYDAAKYLLELGHRKFLHYIGGIPEHPRSVEMVRMSAFTRACSEEGLDADTVLTRVRRNADDREESTHLLLRAIADNPDATAIIAHDDEQAVWIFETLIRNGYRVPEDFSLLGFDDTDPVFDARHENILSTVRLPLVDIGREGTRLLIRQITGGERPDVEITVPTELVVRMSTASPHGSANNLKVSV
jgi:LacI family transcriptional regulator